MAKLKVYLTKRLVKVFEVDKPVLTIGRSSQSDVQLLAKSVSRNHAHILKEGDRLLLEDLGSSNGTKLNGVRINRAYLNDGDIIAIGEIKATYFEKEAPPVAVENVLTIKKLPLEEDKVEELLDRDELGLIFPTERDVIDASFDIARRFIERVVPDQEAMLNLQTALYEAVDNARRHGNRDDSAKKIRIFLRDEGEGVTATVIDEGEGFDFITVLRKTAAQDSLTAARERYMQGGMGGLGIRLMLKCVDRLEYDNEGSKITLYKKKGVEKVPSEEPSGEIEEVEMTEAELKYKQEVAEKIQSTKMSDMEAIVEKYKDRISHVFEGKDEKSEGEPDADEEFLSFNLPDEFDLEDDFEGGKAIDKE